MSKPWKEAERLGVDNIVKRLGWKTGKLASELGKCASDEAFLERVRRAVEAGDPPRLLPRRTPSDYVTNPHMAMGGSADPGEAVQEDCGRRQGVNCCERHQVATARERWRQHANAQKAKHLKARIAHLERSGSPRVLEALRREVKQLEAA